MKKKKVKHRNMVMMIILFNDPGRIRTRVVLPEKGQGRKERPRKKSWDRFDKYPQKELSVFIKLIA